ncbi:MAG: ABC transporter ATP-binding protein [Eubacterium sp.]|nr:ABC transporter ATP-binding protein [Eubacterium sp.]
MIKKLIKFVGEYKKYAILTPIMTLAEVVVDMFIPTFMASLVDKGVNAGDMNHIVKMGWLMVLMAVLGLLTGILSGRFGAIAASGFAKNLRYAEFKNVQTFSFSNIDRFSTASLVTRLTTDVQNIMMAFMMMMRMLVRAPFSMIIAMVFCFRISARLSLIFLGGVGILIVAIAIIMTMALKYFRQTFPKYDDLNASIQENVTGIRVVKAFVREDYEKEKMKKASKAIYKLFVKAEGITTFMFPIMQFVVYSCIILVSWFGAQHIIQDQLTTGQLMSLLTYCMNILMSIMMVSMVFVMISMSTAAAGRVIEVLDEKSDIVNSENPVFEVKDGSISFEDVVFSYHKGSEKPVLQHINLDIPSGATIGIVGGTGSAKSTLVNMISRLYDVDEGSVMVGGVDVRDYDIETLRNMVSVVLQNNVLFSGSILENLRWGDKDATLEQVKAACDQACASEFIEKMPQKYDTKIEQGGANVSGGQKQRLCIARALLKHPKVLILDDSTSAVDTATEATIRKAFAESIPDTTKIIIAQRISSVQDADKIVVLDDGRVDGFDTHENLLKNNDIYREVFESQQRGSGDFDENGGED